MFRFSTTAGLLLTQSSIWDTDWLGFCRVFDPAVSPWFTGDKKQAPMWSPADFDGRNSDGFHVKTIGAFVGDFDSKGVKLGPVEMSKLLERIRSLDLCALIHSSASHVRDAWAWRCVIPFSSPVPSKDWSRVWNNAAAYFGCTGVDSACRDKNRRYFAPTYSPDAFFQVINGSRFLSVADLPDLGGVSSSEEAKGGLRAASRATADLLRRWQRTDPMDHDVLKALATGEEYADPQGGERHTTIRTIAARLAAVHWVQPEAFAELFRVSLQRTARHEAPEDLAGMIRTWREKLDNEKAETRGDMIARAFGGRWHRTYSDDELEIMRQGQAVGGQTDVPTLGDRWVVQHGADFFFLRPVFRDDEQGQTKIIGSTYAGPYAVDAPAHAAQFFAATEPLVQAGSYVEGQYRPKSMGQLVREYGRAVDRVALSFEDEHSHQKIMGGKTTLVQSIGWIDPDLRPEFSQRVDHLLRLQVRDEYVNDYLFWLGVATRYEHPLKALYFNGPRGIAKTLVLNRALGRIHGQAKCTQGQSLLKRFNGAALRHPMAVWDDDPDSVADIGGPRKVTTSQLRAWLSDPSRTIELKGREEIDVFGHMRFVFLTNGQEMIVADSIDDAQEGAIAERVLYVEGHERARNYLESSEQIEVDEIANHMLWLRQYYARCIPLGRFFLPAATSGSAHFARSLRVRFGGIADFFDAVLSALLGAEKIPGMSVQEGQIVMSRAAVEMTHARSGSRLRKQLYRERVMAFFSTRSDGAQVLDLEYLKAFCATSGQDWSAVARALAATQLIPHLKVV